MLHLCFSLLLLSACFFGGWIKRFRSIISQYAIHNFWKERICSFGPRTPFPNWRVWWQSLRMTSKPLRGSSLFLKSIFLDTTPDPRWFLVSRSDWKLEETPGITTYGRRRKSLALPKMQLKQAEGVGGPMRPGWGSSKEPVERLRQMWGHSVQTLTEPGL